MKYELDDIRQVLRHAPAAKIHAAAKQAAISEALREFDKKYAKTSQGNKKPQRLKDTAENTAGQTIFGRLVMKQYQTILIGAFCAVFVVWAFVPKQTWTGFMQPEQKQAVFAEGEQQDKPVALAREERAKSASADESGRIQAERQVAQAKQALTMAAATPRPKLNEADAAGAKKDQSLPSPAATLGVNGTVFVTKVEEKPLAVASSNVGADYKAAAERPADAVRRDEEISVAPASPARTEPMAYGAGMAAAVQSAKPAESKAKTELGRLAFAPPASQPPVVVDDTKTTGYHDQGRDKFKEIKVNPLKLAKDEPVSTFSIDVDTASYGFVRGSLSQNVLPQKDAVRIEELVNYFPYDYSAPASKEEPFKATVSVFPTPWNKDTKLMHIGIKGYALDAKAKPRANLVFLLDTSGSMEEPNKLPLVQNALKMLLDSLNEDDSVAIVTYAGTAGVALEPTKIKDKGKIIRVIDNLGAGGSTAGAEGIRQAYQLAEQNFDAKGINRVILATDGDFNVGITDPNELKSFVERKRATGVTLSVLGFGTGNYNDTMMQTLAQNGNGNASYIDTINEARKVLVEEAGSTLFTIAKDVKIQVEFNPAQVAEYRLIGYETRLLNTEDFNNDKVDAGDIGAGHSVTALYEITPLNSKAKLVDDLRYQKPEAKTEVDKGGEYAFVKIRYKLPEGDTSKLITTPVNAESEFKTLDNVPVDSRFAASVAGFGQLLRGDAFVKDLTYDSVISLAEGAKGTDKFGYRAEFVNLVRLAKNAPALPVLK